MPPAGTEAAALTGHARTSPWFWIIPSLTFGVGLLAGTALTAGEKGPAGPEAASSPPACDSRPVSGRLRRSDDQGPRELRTGPRTRSPCIVHRQRRDRRPG